LKIILCLYRNILLVKNKQENKFQKKKNRYYNKDENEKEKKN